MPAVSRKGDQCTGDGCFPPRPAVEGSSVVYVDGQEMLRVGDALAPHSCGTAVHDGKVSAGSSFVFDDGKAVARVGDDVSCGSAMAEGADFVFIEE